MKLQVLLQSTTTHRLLLIHLLHQWLIALAVSHPAVLSLCSDYEMLIVNTRQCVSRCPLRCNANGVCYEDGACPCEGQYEIVQVPAYNECSLVCAAECLPGCKSAGGYCAGAALCVCPGKSQRFDPVARRCVHWHHKRDRCFGRCLYGTCDASNGNCTCAQGYAVSNATSILPFGQLCAPQCNQDCGRLGYCYMPNMCACRKKHYHYQSDGRCHKDHDYLV